MFSVRAGPSACSANLTGNSVRLLPHCLLSNNSNPCPYPVSALPSSLLFLSLPICLSHRYLSFPPSMHHELVVYERCSIYYWSRCKVLEIGQETACLPENYLCNYRTAANWKDRRDSLLKTVEFPINFTAERRFSRRRKFNMEVNAAELGAKPTSSHKRTVGGHEWRNRMKRHKTFISSLFLWLQYKHNVQCRKRRRRMKEREKRGNTIPLKNKLNSHFILTESF